MCDLLDGVQPLFLGGLLGFELGLLLRIGFRGDLLIKLSELSVELFFEGGLAGVVACSVVSLVFSDAVTFSSAMASSFK